MDNCRLEHDYPVNNAGVFFVGLLMGGLIGSGAMLLLAPQSGKKTRAKLQREGLEVRDQVVETVEDAVGQARSKAHRIAAQAHDQTKELQQRGRDILDEQKKVLSKAVESGKAAVHDIANS
jgi:gas vesicle protein